ncbi:sugar phosphate isomerase/epimerase [soil metagenome]|nr:sugar phosphate isomerase/epimerase [Trueperaceae bacterium]
MRLGFSPVTSGMLDVSAAFRLADELGLAFIELAHDLHEIAPGLQDPARINELRTSTGIGVTVHLSYVDLNLASLIPAARRTSVERTQRGLEFAHAVEATCGVLHTGLSYLEHPQAAALVASALDASLAELEGSSVPIALENLCLTTFDYVRGPRHLHELTTRHGLRNTVDFGHAHVEATRKGGSLIGEYLDLLGADVVHLHVHNNHGGADDHLPTTQGTIEYAHHIDFLRTFEGTVCLEIVAGGSGEDGVRASVAHLRGLERGTA